MDMKDYQKRVILADEWVIKNMPMEHQKTLSDTLEIMGDKVMVLERLGETQILYIQALLKVIAGQYENEEEARRELTKLDTRMQSITEQIQALNTDMENFDKGKKS